METQSNEDDINPFGASEGLEWVDELGPGWWIPKSRRTDSPVARELTSVESSGEHSSNKPMAMTVCMADIQPEQINWLWQDRIALGKLSLIAGDPGLGKSLLTATMAATVSKGYTWPLTNSVSQIGSVVLLSAEDDPADTIRPRLDAAEADCGRIHVLQAIRDVDAKGNSTQRMFSFKRDLAALEEQLSSLPDCKLLIIDPVSAYLDGTDSHNNTDVRGLLAPLAKLAADHDIAVVLVQHLNKSSGSSAMYRAIGSVAFIAAARAAYVVTKDQKNPERRLVMPVKNNLAKDSMGLAYSISTAENGAPVIAWELEPVMMTADEALTPSDSNEGETDTDWAITVLESVLSKGPVLVAEVQKEAKQAGISPKSLRTAREKLGVNPKKVGFNAGWVWSLPQHEDALKGEDAHSENEGTLGVEGHLGVK